MRHDSRLTTAPRSPLAFAYGYSKGETLPHTVTLETGADAIACAAFLTKSDAFAYIAQATLNLISEESK